MMPRLSDPPHGTFYQHHNRRPSCACAVVLLLPQRPAKQSSYAVASPEPASASAQVSFLELIGNTLGDFTIIVLIISGLASIGLELAFGKQGDNGWIEGAAILAAVAVVALVTAVNDYEKEQQFRQLSALSSETQVGRLRWPERCNHVDAVLSCMTLQYVC